MKSFIKSSLLTALLIIFFAVGTNSATAKNPKNDKTVIKVTNYETVPLRCSMRSMANLSIILDNGSKKSFESITALLDPTCAPATFKIGNTITIIDSDCNIRFITVENK